MAVITLKVHVLESRMPNILINTNPSDEHCTYNFSHKEEIGSRFLSETPVNLKLF